MRERGEREREEQNERERRNRDKQIDRKEEGQRKSERRKRRDREKNDYHAVKLFTKSICRTVKLYFKSEDDELGVY